MEKQQSAHWSGAKEREKSFKVIFRHIHITFTISNHYGAIMATQIGRLRNFSLSQMRHITWYQLLIRLDIYKIDKYTHLSFHRLERRSTWKCETVWIKFPEFICCQSNPRRESQPQTSRDVPTETSESQGGKTQFSFSLSAP